MIASIWAQSPEGVIGAGGKVPWHYKGDLKRFKRITLGSTVVMGRKTWESIGKPLPGRENIVVTSSGSIADVVRVVDSLETLLYFGEHREDVWIIGGAQIYKAAMAYVDAIDVTYVPDHVEPPPCTSCGHVLGLHTYGHGPCAECGCVLYEGLVFAPKIYETVFAPGELLPHEDEPVLTRRVFVRRSLSEAPYDDPSNRRLQEMGYLTRK